MAEEKFHLVSSYAPTGDQPQAIAQLVEGVERGDRCQTLLGVTGSGKTFTMANRLADTKNAGGTVSIVFHGMATAIYVWVNGMFVGYGEDG